MGFENRARVLVTWCRQKVTYLTFSRIHGFFFNTRSMLICEDSCHEVLAKWIGIVMNHLFLAISMSIKETVHRETLCVEVLLHSFSIVFTPLVLLKPFFLPQKHVFRQKEMKHEREVFRGWKSLWHLQCENIAMLKLNLKFHEIVNIFSSFECNKLFPRGPLIWQCKV